MLATFSTTNTIQESAIILPQPDSGFGIAISPNASMHPLIEMNAPIHFTLATGATLASTYTAGLLWLSRTPKLGPFSATAKMPMCRPRLVILQGESHHAVGRTGSHRGVSLHILGVEIDRLGGTGAGAGHPF